MAGLLGSSGALLNAGLAQPDTLRGPRHASACGIQARERKEELDGT
jgi:hypothetical protein